MLQGTKSSSFLNPKPIKSEQNLLENKQLPERLPWSLLRHMTKSEKETELSAQHLMGLGENITAMPQYFHMDVKMELNFVNVPEFQEKGHLVVLSRSIWQAALLFFSRNQISVQPLAPNMQEVLMFGRHVLYTNSSLKLNK